MGKYSRPAIEFQKSIREAALFRVHDYPAYLPLRGSTLTITETLKITSNPDDYLYRVRDSEGAEHEIRCGWLRRNCERVD